MKKTLEGQLEPIENLKKFEKIMELVKRYPVKTSDHNPPPQYYEIERKISYR